MDQIAAPHTLGSGVGACVVGTVGAVGAAVVGAFEGASVVGVSVGTLVVGFVGAVGAVVVGEVVGAEVVGDTVGAVVVGTEVGDTVGAIVVGAEVGDLVGDPVGDLVGEGVATDARATASKQSAKDRTMALGMSRKPTNSKAIALTSSLFDDYFANTSRESQEVK